MEPSGSVQFASTWTSNGIASRIVSAGRWIGAPGVEAASRAGGAILLRSDELNGEMRHGRPVSAVSPSLLIELFASGKRRLSPILIGLQFLFDWKCQTVGAGLWFICRRCWFLIGLQSDPIPSGCSAGFLGWRPGSQQLGSLSLLEMLRGIFRYPSGDSSRYWPRIQLLRDSLRDSYDDNLGVRILGGERGGGSSKDPSWIVRPDRRGAINRDSVRILRGHFQEPTAGSFQEILFRCCNGQISSNKSGSCRDAFEVCARLSHSALRQEPRSRWQ